MKERGIIMTIVEHMLNEMLDELSQDSPYIVPTESDVFVEGEIMEKISLARFKKRYHYDSNKKTIVIDGETYKCNLDDYSNPYIAIRDEKGKVVARESRSMSTTKFGKETEIILDKAFFNIKTKKRQDAVLYHEVGHSKLHNMDVNNAHLDKNLITPEVYMQILNVEYRNFLNQVKKDMGKSNLTPDEKKKIFSEVKKNFPPKDDYVQKMPESQLRAKMRAEMLKAAKKYADQDNNSHMNVKEIEADRFAASKTSEKALKGGLKDYGKYISSKKEVKRENLSKLEEDLKQSNPDKAELLNDKKIKTDVEKKFITDHKKYIDAVSKNRKNNYKSDVKKRSEALKDKDLRKASIYK